MNVLQRILNFLLLPLIIFGAVKLADSMIAGKPPRKTVKQREVIPRALFVEAQPAPHTPTISTFGNTRSFNQAIISAQVGGEIVTISDRFNTGRTVAKGDLLLEINPADYLALIAQQEAALAQAHQVLAEEETRSQIAVEDWLDSNHTLDEATDFTLRKPQLAAAEAGVASSQAALQKARLDLERTRIRAPFDAIVSQRSASPGNVVTGGSNLGTLIAREKIEVRLPLTPQQMSRLTLPSPAEGTTLSATLTSPAQPGRSWAALLTRTEPSVDPQNQVLFLIAEVSDPFANPASSLPIGTFVNATIEGNEISNCYQLPNSALVEDAFIWTISKDNKLEKQNATRVFSEDNFFLARIEDSAAGERLRVAIRPLASFREEQTVAPTPAER